MCFFYFSNFSRSCADPIAEATDGPLSVKITQCWDHTVFNVFKFNFNILFPSMGQIKWQTRMY